VTQNSLLRRTLNIPTAQELMEQLILAQRRAHKAMYAKISAKMSNKIPTSSAPSLKAAMLKTWLMARFKS
jgi:hypothetical protein